MNENLTLSDIAAVTNSDGFGGNNAWILILMFLVIFNGGGYYGNRTGELNQYATAASQQEILFGQQFQNIDNKLDRLGNGIADATFALNNSVKDGNAAVASAVITEGRSTQAQIAQFNSDQAMRDCAIKEAVHAEGEATRAMIQQNKIESLQAQVNELKTQNMFCGIPRINPYGYQVVPNPTCGCNCGNI